MEKISKLQQARKQYCPKLPASLADGIKNLEMIEGERTKAVRDENDIQNIFKNVYGAPIVSFKKGGNRQIQKRNVGVILSGGQAPGGHNVIAGLFDALKAANPDNKLYYRPCQRHD